MRIMMMLLSVGGLLMAQDAKVTPKDKGPVPGPKSAELNKDKEKPPTPLTAAQEKDLGRVTINLLLAQLANMRAMSQGKGSFQLRDSESDAANLYSRTFAELRQQAGAAEQCAWDFFQSNWQCAPAPPNVPTKPATGEK